MLLDTIRPKAPSFVADRRSAPVALAAGLLFMMLAGPMGLVGCGDDGGGGAGGGGGGGDVENDGVVACRAACDTQLADCPTFDHEGCNTICDAYEITTDTPECIQLLAAWQNCQAAQTYMCAPSPNEDLAFPEDPNACDVESDAYFNDPDC